MTPAGRMLRTLGLAITLTIAGAGLGLPRARAADAAAAQLPAWLDDATLNGFLSTRYTYNFNRPDSRTNQLRVFDQVDNSFELDVFELVMQRVAAQPGQAGFRVDLALGSSVPRVASARGLFRTDSTTAEVDLQQMFASYVAPLGSGLRIDAGKFITPHGYEVIEGYDGWNDNATRSILFGFAIPFTHTGARVTYVFSKQITGVCLLVNGWDVAEDNNRSKTAGGQLLLTPAAPWSITLNAMTGPERANDDSDPRTLFDGSVVWKVTPHATLGANGDWGSERGAVAAGQVARWNGYAGYARAACGNVALSLRGESFDDRDGARTGTAQRLTEFTLTPEARCTPNLMVRADLRVDHSNRRVFDRRMGSFENQPTVSLNVIYSF